MENLSVQVAQTSHIFVEIFLYLHTFYIIMHMGIANYLTFYHHRSIILHVKAPSGIDLSISLSAPYKATILHTVSLL